jgi:iron complex transport system substrate-binding protein
VYGVRIVSLLPSATEIVCLLGLQDQLVGISADSDWPVDVVQRLPVLNTISIDTSQLSSREIDRAASGGHTGASLYHVDPDLLRELRPELILTQEICEVCAVSRRDVELAARTLGYVPRVLSLNPATLDEVLDDVDLVARSAGVPQRGEPVVASLEQRIEAVRARTSDVPRPEVLCMEWLDPIFTAGHWVPEMVQIAGGHDDLGTPAGPSRRVAWQQVVDYAPEIVVLMPCSLELDRVASEFGQLRSLSDWPTLPAVQTGQVYAGNTALFSRSGPRLLDGLEVLARVLHPDLFTNQLPKGQALKVTPDGHRLEPFR